MCMYNIYIYIYIYIYIFIFSSAVMQCGGTEMCISKVCGLTDTHFSAPTLYDYRTKNIYIYISAGHRLIFFI